jgi:hypothetical protein
MFYGVLLRDPLSSHCRRLPRAPLRILSAHVLIGKPVPTFPGHAVMNGYSYRTRLNAAPLLA